MEIVGHSAIEMTMNVYGHVNLSTQRSALNQLGDDREPIFWDLPSTDSSDYGWGRGGPRPVYPCTGKPQGLFAYQNRSTGLASTAGKYAAAFALGASVFGERIHTALLAEMTGPTDLGPALDEAAAAGILRDNAFSPGLRFEHALVRDAVYAELTPSRRAVLHRQAALLLAQAGEPDVAGMVASHWHRAGGLDAVGQCQFWGRAGRCRSTTGAGQRRRGSLRRTRGQLRRASWR